jgi:hypothetical protein
MNDYGAKSKLSAPLIYLSKTGNYSTKGILGEKVMRALVPFNSKRTKDKRRSGLKIIPAR